jgi:hypothetical protein
VALCRQIDCSLSSGRHYLGLSYINSYYPLLQMVVTINETDVHSELKIPPDLDNNSGGINYIFFI